MTDDERLELFRNLTRVIRDAGLEWVVDEVTSLIDQGLELEVSADQWAGIKKPKRGEVRTTRRDYAPLEQIDLLLDATTRVLSQGLAVEAAVLRHFQPDTDDTTGDEQVVEPMQVHFASEPRVDDDDGDGFVLGSTAELTDRANALTELAIELERVRAEAASG